jgi:hypothetical protein
MALEEFNNDKKAPTTSEVQNWVKQAWLKK